MLQVLVVQPIKKVDPVMSKHRIILSGVLIVLALGVLTPQFAQDVSTEQRHDQGLLVGLVRTINTAEAVLVQIRLILVLPDCSVAPCGILQRVAQKLLPQRAFR